jgi:hypothetical protein
VYTGCPEKLILKEFLGPGVVAHEYNPSYVKGGDRGIMV